MKRWTLLFALALVSLPLGAHAQNKQPGVGGFYSFGAVSTTGQLGSYLDYRTSAWPPASYTVDWTVAGTAPSVCTFQVEGSSDAVHWYALTAATSCTTANMMHIAFKPVVFARINMLTYTAGDGTTRVTVNYTRGQ